MIRPRKSPLSFSESINKKIGNQGQPRPRSLGVDLSTVSFSSIVGHTGEELRASSSRNENSRGSSGGAGTSGWEQLAVRTFVR